MRLIDADAVKFNFQYGLDDNGILLVPYRDAKKLIEAAKTVDAVPVVRCRECNQGEIDDPDFPDQYYCHAGCGWNKGDFYCAYGERKEV